MNLFPSPAGFSLKVVRAVLVFFAVVFFIGCAPLPKQRTSGTSQELAKSPLLSWAITHQAGDHAVLDDPEFGGKVMAELTKKYRAASGLKCKMVRVRVDKSLGEDVSICQKEDDSWFLVPQLSAGNGYLSE